MSRPRPNILFIIADQWRHDFLGYSGNGVVDTPNIDALASRGTVFTQCTTTSPVCGPARIGLATGLLPTRTGTTENKYAFMPVSTANHYRHFRDNGYRVEVVGRHDLAKPGNPASQYGTRPLNYSYGFTRALELEGLMSSSQVADSEGPRGPYTCYLADHGVYDTWAADYKVRQERDWILGASSDSALAKEHHIDAFIGRTVQERLRTIEDDYPWYLLVVFQSPHNPYDPPAELGSKYRTRSVPGPIPADFGGKPRRIQQLHAARFSGATPSDIVTARRQYAATVELVDQQVGLFVDAVESRGMLENTVIVVTSDHGDHLGDHGLFEKQTAYEASMRVPLVVTGPGIAPGRSDALVEMQDLNPTLTEVAGLPAQPALDAQSFAPVLSGSAAAHRDAAVCCQSDYRAIRTRTHKYIETYNDRYELYDLKSDPREQFNLIDTHGDIARDLSKQLDKRLTQHRWRR